MYLVSMLKLKSTITSALVGWAGVATTPERAMRVTKDAEKSIVSGFAKKIGANKKDGLDEELELEVVSGELKKSWKIFALLL